jgi:iron(III) transport system substrate-binding protein
MTDSQIKRSTVLLPVLSALLLVGLWLSFLPQSGSESQALVVYCSHDRIFAEQILEEFSRQTGIRVQTRYDTEATKSLGLINQIVQERQHPRCDVFWNNELLGMVELQQQGLLEADQGTGWHRMPERYRDADGYWTGFAARMRVSIFNTQQAAASDETLEMLLKLEPSRLAMAKPLFGTTLTHYTVLWEAWGGDRLKNWHQDLRLRGLREVDGNAAVKDIVAQGSCDAGLTDTDDVFVALDDGQPVEMQPVRISHESNDGQSGIDASPKPGFTICIPNTVGIMKGTKHREAAERLVDFLTSAETELTLARSRSRQIPLGPIETDQVPADVQKLTEWAKDGIDLRSLLPARRDCLAWLKSEYLK